MEHRINLLRLAQEKCKEADLKVGAYKKTADFLADEIQKEIQETVKKLWKSCDSIYLDRVEFVKSCGEKYSAGGFILFVHKEYYYVILSDDVYKFKDGGKYPVCDNFANYDRKCNNSLDKEDYISGGGLILTMLSQIINEEIDELKKDSKTKVKNR